MELTYTYGYVHIPEDSEMASINISFYGPENQVLRKISKTIGQNISDSISGSEVVYHFKDPQEALLLEIPQQVLFTNKLFEKAALGCCTQKFIRFG